MTTSWNPGWAERLVRGLGDLRAPATQRLREGAAWLRARPRASAALVAAGAALLLTGAAVLRGSRVDGALTTTVQRGTLVIRMTEAGIMRPVESITYRSPLPGRESEIVFLVPEGTLVQEGDLLVRLDATELKRELDRAVQDSRQAQVELQVAEVEKQEGIAAVDSLEQGEGALNVDEARSALRLAEKKAARLREESASLKPLMEKGFITREELDRSAFELEQAEAELQIARRKAEVLIQQTHPRGQQRAKLQLAQKEAQLENARARLVEARARLQGLQEAVENCNLYARRPGLVVYEEFLAASPRRKVRMGDRVTQSQGIVTIPEVKRMLVEASVPETDVHRVRPGQPATIRLDAYPDLRLTGKVTRVGTLARISAERPWEDKRFDLIVEIDPAEADLRPEMTARVDILVGEKKDVLLLPINAVFDRQGVLVAHVVRLFGVETRQVELGESNDLYVEVLRGLREKDRVSLADVGAGGAPVPATAGESEQGPFAPASKGGASSLAPR